MSAAPTAPQPSSPSGEDALSSAQLREHTARSLALVRLVAVGAVAALGGVLALRGNEAWRAASPPLLGFVACSIVLTAVACGARFRHLGARIAPFVDLLFTFAVLRQALPASDVRPALAGATLGVFVCIVVVAALTQGAREIAATTALAFLFTALLERDGGMPADLVAVSGLLLAVTALVTGWSARRLKHLSHRLAREGAAHEAAVARGAELQRWNERITSLNAALEEQQTRFVLAQREAETLMGLLVHDMKQPLASIQGLVEEAAFHLSRDPLNAEVLQEDLAVVREQTHRLLAMISDLAAISRLEKGTMTARKQMLRMMPLLSETADHHQSRANGVSLAVRGDEVAAATVDQELVQRMVENLVANAISFTRPGDRIELSARREGPLVALSVKSSGPPVPVDVRPLLFEKRIGKGGRARHNAGLGLYFCRLVAEAHQGHIALEADPDFNVSFVVRLPVGA